MSWVSDPIGKSFPELPHTQVNAQIYDAVMVIISQKLGRKCTVTTEFELRTNVVQIHYVICSPTGASCLVL